MELNFPKIEEEILKFWKEKKVFEQSVKQRAKARDFVFYEGPPTANGRPGIHHILSRAFKDIICRYKTMRGFRVLRKAGWDTHGLPVELEVEKKLGIKSKPEIEKYGIAKFNEECKKSVWQYKEEWEKLTERIGFWLDMEHPYITYKNEYIETLWWIIKQIHKKGLLYRDYKVVPYCSRCGTSLSSHEVAQGYKKVKEPAIYVKFQIKSQNAKLLVWTTTPWTLPGNTAVAVNPGFTYAKVKVGEEYLILAKKRIESVGINGEILEEFQGSKLLGLEYEPPFRQEISRVIAGDFVSIEEGTGLVHIAPAFGEDDMRVGKENNLPVILNVDTEGKFKKEVENWAGMFVKDADPLIIEELKKRNLLFREELYEHDYPFCWRCKSPLLYYAKESWFINMQKVKDKLIGNNQKINWVPAHLKEGRFGEWLKDLKDWAFSRERYWGTPLPVWQCKKCGKQEVIEGKKDLFLRKFSSNSYFVLRHGQTSQQTERDSLTYASAIPESPPILLTKTGEEQIKKAAKALKKEGIDFIFASDMPRTRQTAEIVAKETGAKIQFDARLRDINMGTFHGRRKQELYDAFPKMEDRLYLKKPEGGETWGEVRKRMADFLADIDGKFQGKHILIISHGDPLWLLAGAMNGLDDVDIIKQKIEKSTINVGEWQKIVFKKLPLNASGELDFHRPYIDEVKFTCPQCQGWMERTPEVADVWFDSGSMPFAQVHYPAGKKDFQFPADYISEAIDQTRGWFYTLLAVSTLLDFGAPYKNVISSGHVLDEKGEKMSKSKGNVVDPWQVVSKYGADAVRWYFYTVNQPGDSKLFSEKDIDQTLKKFILILWNCFTFYQTYKTGSKSDSKNILDKWIISKLNGLIAEVTEKLDKYDITGAARAIEDFTINDLSLWYIRRSRKRFDEAEATLHYVLLNLIKLISPILPFLSEEIYQNLKTADMPESVHLCDWPKADKRLISEKLGEEMAERREIISKQLAKRAEAKQKIRQPLGWGMVVKPKSFVMIDIDSTARIIEEETNIKEIVFGENFKLDTTITIELKEEGIVREVVRQINEMRKKAGLTPQDKISIQYSGAPELNDILERHKNDILNQTRAYDFTLGQGEMEVEINGQKLRLTINKI